MDDRRLGALALFFLVIFAPLIYNTQMPSLVIFTLLAALMALAAAWGVGENG